MAYPLPTNITRFYKLFEYANTVTSDWFGILVIIATFVISFATTKKYVSEVAFSFASFFTAIVAILFWIAGIVHGLVVFITIILAGLGVVALLRERFY